ncbi:hypothetical protein [Oryzobacter telluris]|uniref:hypothetical protein n=1 Tax=Oryzobacter telluris TaxID=3149179 RepID=UPI00370DCD66
MSGLHQLAHHLRAVAARVEVRRASLGPASLAWWEGPGADAHREQVAVRRVALAGLCDDLVEAAREAEALAVQLEARGPAP